MAFADRLRFLLEYLTARGLFAALGRLPAPVGRPVSRGLGRAIGAVAAGRRRVALANMERAFPEEPLSRRVHWFREMWAGLGEWFWELARYARLSPAGYWNAVQVEGLDRLKASHARGKGVLIFTAHCGNWEYATAFMSLSGLPLAMIARRAKNPSVNDYLTAVRERFGGRVLLHKNAVRESIRWLKAGGVLGMLFDQRITDGGVTAPFFGHPARTTALPALLALRLGCPVHPVLSWREGGKIHIEVGDALAVDPVPPTPENIERLTARMNGLVEGWIRRRPAQWLWIHNRWKP